MIPLHRSCLSMMASTAAAAVAGLLTAPIAGGAAPDQRKPNFVLIFVDDMGFGDIGPFGSQVNRTPNLDRMAAEGMKLTSFYAAPVCSASRAQLLTGSYAPRVSVPGVFFPAGKHGLNPDERTVAEYLREAGYATMCVGKWHLGDQRVFLPTNQGFDGYLGIPYSNDMARPALEDGRSVHPLVRDTEVAELLEDEDQRRVTRLYTEEAVRFIEGHADEPFFLYLPHTAMHVPLFPHPDFVGRSANGTYGDWVEEVDWSVGRILETLRRLDLEEETLVLFTSDNGPWASKGKAGGVAGPLRGSKGGTLEGGVREPTLAWWPGTIEAGSTCDAVAGTTDVLPTFVSLAGGTVRDDVILDGRDIAPLLLGQATESPHEAWFYFSGNRLEAVRAGPWKLAVAPQSLGMGIREKPADLARAGRLYHLDRDIGETTDVAADHPDVVARLTRLADAMRADIEANRRPPGIVAEPVTLYPTRARDQRTPAATGRPVDWSRARAGDAFAAASAPRIAGRAFTLTAALEGTDLEGVVAAHGGSAVGFVLYAKDGKLVFAVRHGEDAIRRVRVPAPVADGPHAVTAGLGGDGTLRLAVGGGTAATAASPGPLARNPQEDLCIGHDNRNPVDPEAPAGSFRGTIRSVRVTVE